MPTRMPIRIEAVLLYEVEKFVRREISFLSVLFEASLRVNIDGSNGVELSISNYCFSVSKYICIC
jgi:hypothetical protein